MNKESNVQRLQTQTQLHLSAVEKSPPRPRTLCSARSWQQGMAHRDALCQQLGRKQLFRATVFLEE